MCKDVINDCAGKTRKNEQVFMQIGSTMMSLDDLLAAFLPWLVYNERLFFLIHHNKWAGK